MSILMPFVLLDPPGGRERTDFRCSQLRPLCTPAPAGLAPAWGPGPRLLECVSTQEQKQKGAGF